jgi:signal transduction histidine kinase/HPt (histidine-containing phosphotransfer) domain-containing protein/ActR/RegA family two-component response regulator
LKSLHNIPLVLRFIIISVIIILAFTVISFRAVGTIINCHHACSILLESTIKTHTLAERARADFYHITQIADSMIMNLYIGDYASAESLFNEFTVSSEVLGRDFDGIIALIEKDPFVDKSIIAVFLEKMNAAKEMMTGEYIPEIVAIYTTIKADRGSDVSRQVKNTRARLSDIAENVLSVADGVEVAGNEAYDNYVDYLLAQIDQLKNFIFVSIIASLALLVPLIVLIKKPVKDAQYVLQQVKEGKFLDLRTPYKNEIALLLNNVADIIDSYKQVIDEKETMRIEAVKANESKSRFLATMSHEIRTPMNAVIGISEMELIRDDLPKDLADALSKIRNSGHTLLGIINDILDLSKIETGKLELLPTEYDLPSLINDTTQLNVIRIASKPVEFTLEVEPSVPASLVGDGLRIKQILNNILSNAFKYTERGKVTLEVSFAPGNGNGDGLLIFRISDTGQGMRQEDVARLFDEYSRFNLSVNRNTEGTGLGMTITRKLTTMMNGTITVESEYGRGSVFTVSLPQRTIENAGVIGAVLAEQLRKFTFSDDNRGKKLQFQREYMPYGSVLIVDDMEPNLFVAQGLMTPYGLRIETVTSGFAVLDRVRAGKAYDIIFLDHMMPDMDGIETISRLRKMGYKAPIIALTANATTGNDKMFREHGFDDFISKPIDLRQLDAVLNMYVKGRHTEEAKRPHGGGPAAQMKKMVVPPKITLPEVTGVDMAAGIARIGGSQGRYLDLLEMFSRDVKADFSLLEKIPDESSLRSFTTRVHAMKSALANIGAEALSQAAALLEKAGREADMPVIRDNVQPFRDELAALVTRIGEIVATARAGDSETGVEPDVGEALAHLREALEAKDVDAMDDALARLQDLPLTAKMREAVSGIADSILTADIQQATDILITLLDQEKT